MNNHPWPALDGQPNKSVANTSDHGPPRLRLLADHGKIAIFLLRCDRLSSRADGGWQNGTPFVYSHPLLCGAEEGTGSWEGVYPAFAVGS